MFCLLPYLKLDVKTVRKRRRMKQEREYDVKEKMKRNKPKISTAFCCPPSLVFVVACQDSEEEEEEESRGNSITKRRKRRIGSTFDYTLAPSSSCIFVGVSSPLQCTPNSTSSCSTKTRNMRDQHTLEKDTKEEEEDTRQQY